jgi:hypothetical protein
MDPYIQGNGRPTINMERGRSNNLMEIGLKGNGGRANSMDMPVFIRRI